MHSSSTSSLSLSLSLSLSYHTGRRLPTRHHHHHVEVHLCTAAYGIMSRIWYGWRKATLLSSLIRRKEASPFVALREALQGADTGASSSAPHWCEGSAIHSTAEGFRMRLLKSIHTLNGVFHHHTTSKRVLCCHKEMCLSRHRLCLVATCFRLRTLPRVCVCVSIAPRYYFCPTGQRG